FIHRTYIDAQSVTTTSLPNNIPYNITLTWVEDPRTSQAISWQSSSPSEGFVRLARAVPISRSEATVRQAAVSEVEFSRGKTIYFHYINLSGLSPNTKYYYSVGDGKQWSTQLSFTTAGTDAFQFLVFGDSQSSGNYRTWKNSLKNAVKQNSQARFFINVGDLIDDGNDLEQWNYWFSAGKGVVDRIPSMPVRGNHDKNKTNWLNFFKLPVNGPTGARGLTYSFDYGPVHFVALDNIEMQDSSALADQKEWLTQDLKAANNIWKIVFVHKPFYYNKAERNNNYLKNAYEEIFDNFKVDIVFNGHDHVVARTNKTNGSVYYITGRSGTKFYNDVNKMSWNKFFYKPVNQPNYVSVDVSKLRLKITALNQDSSVIDSIEINNEK
ncbi:MAG TPA: metallophosphoesterase family protein, partial [Desulfobacteria bacterium]|nr:metallophosphoesterase family protein [Desulfobacteria bacterium]